MPRLVLGLGLRLVVKCTYYLSCTVAVISFFVFQRRSVLLGVQNLQLM